MKTYMSVVRLYVVLVSSSVALLLMLSTLHAQTPQDAPGDFTPPPNAAWGRVMTDGFGDPYNWHVVTLAEFDDRLYAGTSNPFGAQIWRTDDLLQWTKVFSSAMPPQGFGNHIMDMVAFKGRLYAAGYLNEWGSDIWSSPDGVTWECTVPRNSLGSFGPSDTHRFFGRMQPFDDQLFVESVVYPSGRNSTWRTADGATWHELTPPMAPDSVIMAMAVFSDHLYAGSYFSPSAQIWRTDGISWTAVMTDSFAGEATAAVRTLAVWQGQLYATAMRGSAIGIWRSPDGVSWRAVASIDTQMPYLVSTRTALYGFGEYLYLFASLNGSNAWRTVDGSTWHLVGTSGLGAPNTYMAGSPGIATFRNQMLLGTLNMTTTGGQIIKYLPEVHYLPFVADR